MTEKYEVKYKNRQWHITPSPFYFNNRRTAEQLCKILNEYEELKKQ